MKKVAILIYLSTSLIGCSFAKEDKGDAIPNLIQAGPKDHDLQSTITYQNIDQIREFLSNINEESLNLNFQDGSTPFEAAIKRGNRSILQILIEKGASPFIKNLQTQISPYAAFNERIKNLDKKEAFNIPEYEVLLSIESYFESRLRTLLISKSFTRFQIEIIQRQIPSYIVLDSIFLARPFANELPYSIINTIDKNIDLTRELSPLKLSEYFAQELDYQLSRDSKALELLLFIRNHNQNAIFSYSTIGDSNKKYFISPAVLIAWKKKMLNLDDPFLKDIHLIANFPNEIGILVSSNLKNPPDKAEYAYSLKQVLINPSKEIADVMYQAIEDRNGDFWQMEISQNEK